LNRDSERHVEMMYNYAAPGGVGAIMRTSVSVENGTAVIKVIGNFVFDSGREAKEQADALGDDVKSIVLDMSDVPFIDSAGIGQLVSMLKSCTISGKTLGLSGIRPDVLKVFQITKLDKVFNLG
jgi:anti-sigma B factor antagonist